MMQSIQHCPAKNVRGPLIARLGLKFMVALAGELHASGKWAGITLRPPPDPATPADAERGL